LLPEQKKVQLLSLIEKREYSRKQYFKPNQTVLIASINNESIGFIWYEIIRSNFTNDDFGYILDIYVEEKYRKKGIGKDLIDSMKNEIIKLGIKRIDLSVSNNNKAIKLYEEIGFVKTMQKMCLLFEEENG
jgi:ribosomal protein S18 acetylase RimI-like enzyme